MSGYSGLFTGYETTFDTPVDNDNVETLNTWKSDKLSLSVEKETSDVFNLIDSVISDNNTESKEK